MRPAICAVIVTHATLPKFQHAVTVPYTVTSDVPGSGWADVIVDTGAFNNSELAIGVHMKRAIETALRHFPWCKVVSVVEDDVELAPVYFDALSAVYEKLIGPNPTCFTCVNDMGVANMGPWDPWSVRPVTHSIGLGFAVSRETFGSLEWGIRQWDNFIRATSDMVCFVPEVTLCRHHASRFSTHGVGGESRRLDRLQSWRASPATPWRVLEPPQWPGRYVSSNLFVPNTVPRCNLKSVDIADPNARRETWRGTYNGLVEGNHRALCTVLNEPPTHASPNQYRWLLGKIGIGCTATCARRGLWCDQAGFHTHGSILLREYRRLGLCDEWGSEFGADQPAMVKLRGARLCLVPSHGSVSTCDATYPTTRRLCPCLTA